MKTCVASVIDMINLKILENTQVLDFIDIGQKIKGINRETLRIIPHFTFHSLLCGCLKILLLSFKMNTDNAATNYDAESRIDNALMRAFDRIAALEKRLDATSQLVQHLYDTNAKQQELIQRQGSYIAKIKDTLRVNQ